MGLRFRKSFKIGKKARITLSKSGVSSSIGGRGARITTSTTGRVTRTVGLPGTGLSYVVQTGSSHPKRTPASKGSTSPSKDTTQVNPHKYGTLYPEDKIPGGFPPNMIEQLVDRLLPWWFRGKKNPLVMIALIIIVIIIWDIYTGPGVIWARVVYICFALSLFFSYDKHRGEARIRTREHVYDEIIEKGLQYKPTEKP